MGTTITPSTQIAGTARSNCEALEADAIQSWIIGGARRLAWYRRSQIGFLCRLSISSSSKSHRSRAAPRYSEIGHKRGTDGTSSRVSRVGPRTDDTATTPMSICSRTPSLAASAHVDLGDVVGIAGEAHFIAGQFCHAREEHAGLREQVFHRHRLETGVPDAGSVVI